MLISRWDVFLFEIFPFIPLCGNLTSVFLWLFQVIVTLATLSFFCRRPTILAIMEFVDAINAEEEVSESCSDNSMAPIVQRGVSVEEVADNQSMVEEHVVKGLLGRGKSRIIFYLTLNMARAQILLMNENETKLASLSQDNLVADIKVLFTFSFFF